MGLYRKPDGSVVSIPDDQAAGAIAGGYTPVSPADAGAPVDSAATGGALGTIGAGASSVLSGATLGLSDVALKGVLSHGDYARLAADREDHPVVSGVGQVAGAIGAATLTGGVYTPSGYLSSLAAEGVEAGKAAGGIAGAARGLASVATEGAIQNAGIYLSDAALGDRDVTAEGVAGALGTGFAFGAAGAVAAHGVERGTIAARRMFARVMDGGDKAAQIAAQNWAAHSQSTLEAFDQTATAARAQLSEAQAARAQAGIARQQAAAGVADARAGATGVDAARGPLVGLDESISKIDGAGPAPVGGLDDLQRLVTNYDEARRQFDETLRSVEGLSADVVGPEEYAKELHRLDQVEAAKPSLSRDDTFTPQFGPEGQAVPTGEFKTRAELAAEEPAPMGLGAAAAEQSPVPTAGAAGPPFGLVKIERAAGGSQGGSWYRDDHGGQWFGKHYSGSADRVENEHLASDLYRMFGVDAPETHVVEVDGRKLLASREVPGVEASPDHLASATNAKDGFVVDAWLGNWDAVGMSGDNMLVNGNKVSRVDNGGATIWRAQGGDKEFTTPVRELETMRRNGDASGKVFGQLSDKDVDRQLADFADKYESNKARVFNAIDESGLSAAAKKRVRDGLSKRADWLLARADELRTPATPLSSEEYAAHLEREASRIPADEADALRGYTGNGAYGPVNNGLRESAVRNKPGSKTYLARDFHEYVDKLDRAVAAAPAPRDMLVYRGVNGEVTTDSGRTAFVDMKPGDTFVEHGFVSTSADPQIGSEYAKGFGVRRGAELHITVPDGFPAASVPSSEFEKEKEFILPRGAKYRVSAVEHLDDRTIVHVTVASPDPLPPAIPMPAGFNLSAIETDGKRTVFTASPDVRTGIPKFADLSPATYRDYAYSVRPSELASIGLLGSAPDDAAIARAHGAWSAGGEVAPVEINMQRDGRYAIAGGSEQLFAAAQAGDRPLVVSFRPSQVNAKGVHDISDSLSGALSRKLDTPEVGAGVIPSHEQLKALDVDPVTTVPSSMLRDRGWYELPGQGEDAVKAQNARNAIKEGQRDPINLVVSPSGKIQVNDGRNRLMAAVDADAPIKVRWSYGREPGASDLRKFGAPAEDDALTAALRGTQAKLEDGASLRQLSDASPARAQYVADKAERTAAASEYFRGKANAKNYAASEMGAAERAAQAEARGLGASAAGEPESELERMLRATKGGLDSGAGMGDIGAAGRLMAGEHPVSVKQLELAHDAALEAAATATEPAAKREAVAEAKAIEQQMDRLGARPGAVEDVAAVAPAMTKLESAATELTEAVGEAAPPAAQEAAKAFRAAEDDANRKTITRIARAADDESTAASSAARDRRPGLSGADRVTAAQQRKLEADAGYARARATASEAKERSRVATGAAADARRGLAAAAPAAAVPTAPGRLSSIGSTLLAGAQAVEVAHDVGMPGIPDPHDIPVIGPLLSTYLKYRALRAAAGRFVGRVPATAETRAAALAATVKDKIARAVDRSLGLVADNTRIVRSTLVASSLRVNAALGRRAFDDGQADAPKGSSVQAQAAVRIREVAFAATNPDAVTAMVRKQTRELTDPDLIQALENHLMAMYQHLNDVAPKGPPPNPYTRKEWEPSAAEALQFGRRLAVAHDPTAAFDALRTQSLTPGEADTMRTVYQRLFQLAQQRLIERAADLKHPVAYRQLIQNGVLFDVPLHASLDPENAAVLAGAHAPAAAASPGGGGAPPTASIANATDLSKIYETSSDRRSLQR